MKVAVGRTHVRLAVLAIFVVIARAAAAQSAGPPAGTVTAKAQAVALEYPAYARVRPIALVPIRAVETGIVRSMRVEPGSSVRAGEPLATLSGPEVEALLVSRQGAVHSAITRLSAARRTLEAARSQLAGQLSTRQSVASAESAVAAAAAALQSARARLTIAQQTVMLRAPSSGSVIAVSASSGQRIVAGQTLLTLQPSGSLWLQASYYGEDAAAIHVGMKGRFEPAFGGNSIPVRVATVFASLAADGGERVGLIATGSGSDWRNGEWGTVILIGPTRHMVAVPSEALIVDRARWWVLVRTARGDRPQAVVPGPTRGWETVIEQGLEPGEKVVAQNAYLEFHRGITRRYTPPDQ